MIYTYKFASKKSRYLIVLAMTILVLLFSTLAVLNQAAAMERAIEMIPAKNVSLKVSPHAKLLKYNKHLRVLIK